MAFSLIGAVTGLIVTILATLGLPGLFALMTVESLGIPPLPSEVILPFAGFLVADGTFSFGSALTVAVAGELCGAFLAYAIGRWWRHRITGLGLGHLRLEQHHLDRVDRYFTRYGEATVGLARLVPVIRSYIPYPAGTARMSPARFGIFTTLGSIPYVTLLILAGMALRSHWSALSAYFDYLNFPLLAAIAAVVVYIGLQVAGILAPGWPPRRVRPVALEGQSPDGARRDPGSP
ncbi:MAG TPA: DedA family protein [Thermoplasmata archaeon]|nr:DedA family protein [Thermoplasmata archaeon]